MEDIEEIAVASVKKVLGRSQYLKSYIDTNDKTPVWDGFLYVYHNSIKNNEELFGRIPVQVKGKRVSSLHNGSISYPFKAADLQNYERDGGVILFVVEISPTDDKIFYKSLLPYNLREILSKLKKKKGAKLPIELKELNYSKLDIFENICKNFILNRKKQYGAIGYLPIEDASDLRIYLIADGTPIEDYLFSSEVSLYGKPKAGEIEMFVTNINVDTIITPVNCNVTINGKLYYTSYEIEKTRKGNIIRFGKSISIDTENQKLKYNFTGTLEEQILDISFMLDMLESNLVLLGDRGLRIPDIEGKDKLVQRYTDSLKEFTEIQTLLELFKITDKALEVTSLDEISYININILIGKFLYNRVLERVPYKPGINAARIGNIYLGIFVSKAENEDGFSIFNLFDLVDKRQFAVRYDNGPFIPISPYVYLTKDLLLLLDNLNFEVILEDIKRIQYSIEYSNFVTDFGLELIKAYDDSNREVLLDAALTIFTWLKDKNEMDFVSQINLFQILKRKRELTNYEKKVLFQMRDKFLDNDRGLCSISILLENKFDAENFYNALSGEDQKVFNGYPIYSLFKKLVFTDT